jgi:hypothetical protein
MTFNLGSLCFTFKSFADWQSQKTTVGERVLLKQPKLLLDIGHNQQHSHEFYVSVEYSYWYNKLGIDGVIECVPQAMILIPF